MFQSRPFTCRLGHAGINKQSEVIFSLKRSEPMCLEIQTVWFINKRPKIWKWYWRDLPTHFIEINQSILEICNFCRLRFQEHTCIGWFWSSRLPIRCNKLYVRLRFHQDIFRKCLKVYFRKVWRFGFIGDLHQLKHFRTLKLFAIFKQSQLDICISRYATI